MVSSSTMYVHLCFLSLSIAIPTFFLCEAQIVSKACIEHPFYLQYNPAEVIPDNYPAERCLTYLFCKYKCNHGPCDDELCRRLLLMDFYVSNYSYECDDVNSPYTLNKVVNNVKFQFKVQAYCSRNGQSTTEQLDLFMDDCDSELNYWHEPLGCLVNKKCAWLIDRANNHQFYISMKLHYDLFKVPRLLRLFEAYASDELTCSAPDSKKRIFLFINPLFNNVHGQPLVISNHPQVLRSFSKLSIDFIVNGYNLIEANYGDTWAFVSFFHQTPISFFIKVTVREINVPLYSIEQIMINNVVGASRRDSILWHASYTQNTVRDCTNHVITQIELGFEQLQHVSFDCVTMRNYVFTTNIAYPSERLFKTTIYAIVRYHEKAKLDTDYVISRPVQAVEYQSAIIRPPTASDDVMMNALMLVPRLSTPAHSVVNPNNEEHLFQIQLTLPTNLAGDTIEQIKYSYVNLDNADYRTALVKPVKLYINDVYSTADLTYRTFVEKLTACDLDYASYSTASALFFNIQKNGFCIGTNMTWILNYADAETLKIYGYFPELDTVDVELPSLLHEDDHVLKTSVNNNVDYPIPTPGTQETKVAPEQILRASYQLSFWPNTINTFMLVDNVLMSPKVHACLLINVIMAPFQGFPYETPPPPPINKYREISATPIFIKQMMKFWRYGVENYVNMTTMNHIDALATQTTPCVLPRNNSRQDEIGNPPPENSQVPPCPTDYPLNLAHFQENRETLFIIFAKPACFNRIHANQYSVPEFEDDMWTFTSPNTLDFIPMMFKTPNKEATLNFLNYDCHGANFFMFSQKRAEYFKSIFYQPKPIYVKGLSNYGTLNLLPIQDYGPTNPVLQELQETIMLELMKLPSNLFKQSSVHGLESLRGELPVSLVSTHHMVNPGSDNLPLNTFVMAHWDMMLKGGVANLTKNDLQTIIKGEVLGIVGVSRPLSYLFTEYSCEYAYTILSKLETINIDVKWETQTAFTVICNTGIHPSCHDQIGIEFYDSKNGTFVSRQQFLSATNPSMLITLDQLVYSYDQIRCILYDTAENVNYTSELVFTNGSFFQPTHCPQENYRLLPIEGYDCKDNRCTVKCIGDFSGSVCTIPNLYLFVKEKMLTATCHSGSANSNCAINPLTHHIAVEMYNVSKLDLIKCELRTNENNALIRRTAVVAETVTVCANTSTPINYNIKAEVIQNKHLVCKDYSAEQCTYDRYPVTMTLRYTRYGSQKYHEIVIYNKDRREQNVVCVHDYPDFAIPKQRCEDPQFYEDPTVRAFATINKGFLDFLVSLNAIDVSLVCNIGNQRSIAADANNLFFFEIKPTLAQIDPNLPLTHIPDVTSDVNNEVIEKRDDVSTQLILIVSTFAFIGLLTILLTLICLGVPSIKQFYFCYKVQKSNRSQTGNKKVKK